MASRFLGLAIQTDVRCASGAAVAFIPAEDLAACSAVLSPTEPESLTFTISRGDARAPEVYAGRVVRTTFATSADDREWDITAVDDAAPGGRVTITAQPIALRLQRALYQGTNAITGAPEFSFSDAAATVTSIIDNRVIAACDAAGLTWVERGTVDSTALVDLVGEWSTAFEILQALAEPGRANGEWQLRRSGDTDYRIDLLNTIGSSAPTVPIRTRVNLLETRRKRETLDLATRAFARGSTESLERTMAAHLWRVKTVVDAEWLELEDILGGAGPVRYDDQVNGFYVAVLNSHTFSSQDVIDSVAATQRIRVASTSGISAGEWCRFFTGAGANGARVTSLRNPTAAATLASGGFGDRARVVDRPALRGDCNLVPNPWMRDYANPSGLPDSWGGNVPVMTSAAARESTIVRDGAPYSCRLTTTGTTADLRIETPDIRPWAIADRRHFCALWFNVQAVPANLASALVFELITSGGTVIEELAQWVRGQNPAEQLDTWIRFSPEVVDLSAITSAVRLRVRITRTNASDAESGWDVVFGPALLAESEIAVADIEYSGGTKLWQEANAALPTLSQLVRGYDLRLLDLARADGSTYSSLDLVPGGVVEVTDTDLAETVSLRLVEYRPDYLNPLASTIRVGALPPDLAAQLADDGDDTGSADAADGALVYTLCEARQTAADDTTVEVTVTATAENGTPSVRLVALEGTATLASGAAVGALVASGSVWTFNRGAFGDGPAQAVFEAVLNDAVTDADLITIPEQGRDTVPLAVRARVTATTASDITVRVAVADPYPQGAGSATIAYSATGLSGISPASGQTCTPDATLTEAGGTYVDFTVPRPAVGSPPGRITFTVTAADRVSDSDAVDVPAAELIYAQCSARQTAADETSVTVTVTAAAQNGTPQVRLVSIAGTATRTAGATVGSLVSSGSSWTFSRGAFEDGPSQVVFEAVLADAVTDADIIEIPEQGRDTVPLVARARVTATTATDITVRVAVADPYPQGANSATIAYSATGLSGISPASGQTVTPESSLTEAANTYVDFTVPRPAVGSPPGRVTFTATASDRTSDSDAVDVPAQDFVAPSLTVVPTPGSTSYSLEVTWDGTISYDLDGSPQSVTGWTSPRTVVVTRNDYLGAAKTATFRVTKNGISTSLTVTVPAKETSGATLTIGAQTADDTTDEYEFSWSSSGFPSGTQFDLIFTTTTTSGNVEQDTRNNQTSPVTVASAFDIGVNPKYQLTINAIKDGVLILTKSRSGTFLT